MTSQFEIPSSSLSYLHANLSDGVIGHVVPRGRTTDRNGVIMQIPVEASRRTLTGTSSDAHRDTMSKIRFNQNETSFITHTGPMTGIRSSVKRFRDENEQIEIKKAIRREQCRNNQARYRDRQRAHQRRMNHKVQQLHEEVQGLKLKRQRLRYGEKTKYSPWGIVSDVFRLLETSFQSPWHMTNADEMMKHVEPQQILAVLQKSFLYDVGMGDLNGVTALLEQLRRYSLYFSDPKLRLKRVEEVVPGVVTATAQFNVTVSEFTLRCVFPHLQPNPVDVFTDELRSLRGKLLGQRLQCNCKLTFLMDQHSGRVARLETSVDWMTPLFQLLKNASEVSRVLSEALLTRNCEVGELTHE